MMPPMRETETGYTDHPALFVTIVCKDYMLIHIKHLEQSLAGSKCSVSIVTVLIKCDLTLHKDS